MNDDMNQIPSTPLPIDPSLSNDQALQTSQASRPEAPINDSTLDQLTNSSTAPQVVDFNDSLNNVPAGYVPGAEAFPSYPTVSATESIPQINVEHTPEPVQEVPVLETSSFQVNPVETVPLPQSTVETNVESALENSQEASLETSVENSVETSVETFVPLAQQAVSHNNSSPEQMDVTNNELHVVDKTIQEPAAEQNIGHPVPSDADVTTMQADKEELALLKEITEHLKTAHEPK